MYSDLLHPGSFEQEETSEVVPLILLIPDTIFRHSCSASPMKRAALCKLGLGFMLLGVPEESSEPCTSSLKIFVACWVTWEVA